MDADDGDHANGSRPRGRPPRRWSDDIAEWCGYMWYICGIYVGIYDDIYDDIYVKYKSVPYGKCAENKAEKQETTTTIISLYHLQIRY